VGRAWIRKRPIRAIHTMPAPSHGCATLRHISETCLFIKKMEPACFRINRERRQLKMWVTYGNFLDRSRTHGVGRGPSGPTFVPTPVCRRSPMSRTPFRCAIDRSDLSDYNTSAPDRNGARPGRTPNGRKNEVRSKAVSSRRVHVRERDGPNMEIRPPRMRDSTSAISTGHQTCCD